MNARRDAVFACLMLAARTASMPAQCSVATLNGTFGFYIDGYAASHNPVAAVGIATFDGKGTGAD